MSYVKPPFSWSGGKRKLLPHILSQIPYRIRNFYSPFLGGGALEIAVLQTATVEGDVFLSDVNPRLIQQWKFIRDSVSAVLEDLEWHDLECDFEQVKADYNAGLQLPGSFIYLVQKCFSAKYRENSDGTFNGTFASDGGKPLPSEVQLKELADLLRLTVLRSGSWTWLLEQEIGEGDVIFCDPPYVGTAVNYAKDGWSPEEQEHLIRSMEYWAFCGAVCLLTETDAVLETLRYLGTRFDYEAVKKVHTICGLSNENTTEVVVRIFG